MPVAAAVQVIKFLVTVQAVAAAVEEKLRRQFTWLQLRMQLLLARVELVVWVTQRCPEQTAATQALVPL
jgi:hypothetical protein